MSDLISRTALLEVLKYNREEHTDENGETRQLIAIDIDKMIEYVEKMPTAYDVDAVVEKMENKIKALGGASCTDAIQDTAVKEIMWCIDIVRSGGKE